VSKFPDDPTIRDLLMNIMDEVVMGLLWGIVFVFKDCSDSRLTVASEFYCSLLYIMEYDECFRDNHNGKYTALFAPIRVYLIRVSWGHVRAGDSCSFAIAVL
jgi:hypothetical protein